jgi:glycosyltransferase involved in cell wall biosynthesis
MNAIDTSEKHLNVVSISPRFTVIVPTRARIFQLRRCLDALAAQDYPTEDYEVIVVNDGSPPLADSDLAGYRKRLVLHSVDQPWSGPSVARNTGIARAKGVYLAFTDDDCQPEPGWLQALDRALQRNPWALVGGHVRNVLPGDPCASASQLMVDYLYERFEAGSAIGPRFFTSNDIAGSARVFRDLAGFDASFRLAGGEDRDLSDRWRIAGHPLLYVPTAIVHHHHSMSLIGFTHQHFSYGRGAWTFHHSRCARHSGARRMESVSFYVQLVCYPLRRSTSLRGLIHSVLLVWAQVVNALGYAYQSFRTSLS